MPRRVAATIEAPPRLSPAGGTGPGEPTLDDALSVNHEFLPNQPDPESEPTPFSVGGGPAADEPVQIPPKGGRRRNGVLEAFLLVTVALVLALTLKTYVAEAYEIKGRSMEPTFHSGERVVVLKAFYEVHRFDIVVFSSREDPGKDLVKRVIGLPGETIRIVAGAVYVDGKLLDEHEYIPEDQRAVIQGIYDTARVPPGHYYVLGDNRPDSHDSRYFESIPETSLRGKVVVRWWPFGSFQSF